MNTPKTPASIRVAAPPSLVAHMAPPGYTVELLVSRSGKTSIANDPDALPALIDQPFEEQEAKNVTGLVAAYEVSRSGSK